MNALMHSHERLLVFVSFRVTVFCNSLYQNNAMHGKYDFINDLWFPYVVLTIKRKKQVRHIVLPPRECKDPRRVVGMLLLYGK